MKGHIGKLKKILLMPGENTQACFQANEAFGPSAWFLTKTHSLFGNFVPDTLKVGVCINTGKTLCKMKEVKVWKRKEAKKERGSKKKQDMMQEGLKDRRNKGRRNEWNKTEGKKDGRNEQERKAWEGRKGGKSIRRKKAETERTFFFGSSSIKNGGKNGREEPHFLLRAAETFRYNQWRLLIKQRTRFWIQIYYSVSLCCSMTITCPSCS